MWGVGTEGLLGAVLTGLMVLLFLRDWRSVIVVVLNIPLALLGAVVGLWLTGQTINLMTLGGLALAVGILVDEATVEVENIHTQFEHTPNIARAVRPRQHETAVPRLLAMLCILAVFLPSFFMEGAARALFVPLSLAVGFSMITSLFPVEHLRAGAVGLAAAARAPAAQQAADRYSGRDARRLMRPTRHCCERLMPLRWVVRAGLLWRRPWCWSGWSAASWAREIFPQVDSGQFQLRLRAPTARASRSPRSSPSRRWRSSRTKSGRTTWRSRSATSA